MMHFDAETLTFILEPLPILVSPEFIPTAVIPQAFCPDGKLSGPSKTQNAHLQDPLYEAVFGAVAVSHLTQVQPGPAAPVAPFDP